MPAVVIGYDGGRGVLLVKHRQQPSLAALVQNYLRAPKSEKIWFAKFKWNAIEPADQEQIQALLRTKRDSLKLKKSKPIPIWDVLSGMVVSCTLVRKPTWEAIQISVDFGSSRFELTKNAAKSALPSSHSDPGKSRFTERLRGIGKSGKSNLGRPWRG